MGDQSGDNRTSRLRVDASLNILGIIFHCCNAFKFALFVELDPVLPNVYMYAATHQSQHATANTRNDQHTTLRAE